MPHPDLASHRDGFFERFLADLPGRPTQASLSAQVLMGDYAEYDGAALTPLPGASITPQFVIRVDEGGSVSRYPMLWMVERLDVATDSAETMARILADFRSPVASTGTTATATTPPGDGLGSELARSWSQALASDAVRQALARNLDQITAVPAGLATTDLDTLRTFLRHFGTYKTDGSYYAKGTIAEGQFPAGASAAYLAADTGNVAELKAQRDFFYCYALAAERLWNPQAEASRFRHLLYRIDDRGAEAGAERWRLALLHTVAANEAGGTASRFVFFHAPVGVGLAIPDGARTTLSAATAALVEDLPERLANLAATLSDPLTPIVGTEASPYVLLIGAVKPTFPSTPLPADVLADGEGAVRTFRCPPQHVTALAARDDVEHLELSTPVWITMQGARTEMNLAARTMPSGMTLADAGRGVVVGIVDGGIDGGHPAFLGRLDDASKTRIHSVWNMWESGGESPYQRGGRHDAYRSMNFGREHIGHDEVVSVSDGGGHGTHVAGIAAGRAFGAWPGGVAPAATIVAAATGSQGGYVNDVVAGVKYCFRKASELGLPCVVNISLATERHSHDASDPLSIAITQLVSEDVVPASGLGTLPAVMPRYIPGRVVCAAAGNLRSFDLHWQATIPAGGETSLLYQPFGRGASSAGSSDGITFWAYNEDATTVRLRVSTRHSSNAVLAAAEVPLMGTNRRVVTNLPGGLRVHIHNGPEAPNNRHFNPEVYWVRPTPAAAVATAPWIVRLRNDGRSACVVHGFAAFREHAGGFVFNAAQTQPLIGVTYTADQLRQFESHKVGTPGTAHGVVTVAAYTSTVGAPTEHVGDLAWFSSPGPLRAAAPGQRAIDCAMPGHVILSAQAGWRTGNAGPGVVGKSGTSMASPMMTGLVAAALQQTPSLNTGQVFNRIELAATRRPTDTVEDWGLGRVNAALFQA